jgi:hypothetical protein
LAAFLAQEEIPAWVDNQLEFGDRWEDVIEQRIREALAGYQYISLLDIPERPGLSNGFETS